MLRWAPPSPVPSVWISVYKLKKHSSSFLHWIEPSSASQISLNEICATRTLVSCLMPLLGSPNSQCFNVGYKVSNHAKFLVTSPLARAVVQKSLNDCPVLPTNPPSPVSSGFILRPSSSKIIYNLTISLIHDQKNRGSPSSLIASFCCKGSTAVLKANADFSRILTGGDLSWSSPSRCLT